MINMRKVLAGAGVALAVALGPLALGAQAAPAQHADGASVETSPSALRPSTPPPSTISASNFGKPMKGVKADKVMPPAPMGGALLTRTAATSPYSYVGGSQSGTNTGLYANMMINWSYTDTYASDNGAHNVAELDAETTRAGGGRDIIEVGTISDRLVNGTGNDEPHLFVFHWINGVAQGYNTGFVPYTGTGACAYHPGDNMGAINGTAVRIGVEYTGSNWWVSEGAQWCGYIPANPAGGSTATNKWYGSGANFTSATKYQAFGEVASSWNEPCTDMGNGTRGDQAVSSPYNYNTMPSYISTVSPVGFTGTVTMGTGYTIPSVSWYKLNMLASGKTFYYGGEGANASGTGIGTRGNC